MESKSTTNPNVTLQYRVSMVLFLGVIAAQAIAWWVHSGAPFAILERWVAVFFVCTGVLLVGWVLALMAARWLIAARWLLLLETPFLIYGRYMSGLLTYSMYFGGRW